MKNRLKWKRKKKNLNTKNTLKMKSNYFGEPKCECVTKEKGTETSLTARDFQGKDEELVIRSEKARRRKKN